MSFLQNQQPRVAMVAGETSGDLLAGLLLDGMRQQWPQVQSYGIGGSQMQQRGFDAWWPSERLAVHGYSFEVLTRLWDILSIRKQLRGKLLQERPNVFVGIDAPDFNLGLEQDLRASGSRRCILCVPRFGLGALSAYTKFALRQIMCCACFLLNQSCSLGTILRPHM